MPPLHVIQALKNNKCRDCGELIKAHYFDDSGFLFNVDKWRRCELGPEAV